MLLFGQLHILYFHHLHVMHDPCIFLCKNKKKKQTKAKKKKEQKKVTPHSWLHVLGTMIKAIDRPCWDYTPISKKND